nr:toprim domain-containing protein [Campylobacter hyointestinalis]
MFKRKIDPRILNSFSMLRQDEKYANAVVPSYTYKSCSAGNKEIGFLIQTGSVSYLSKPLTKDTKGNAYDKPIKQLCNGIKGLEILKADDSQKNLKDFKDIVICESMIDALSYCELKRLNLKETLLCSTNGQISSSQKEVFKHLNEKATDANIILAFDSDKKGMEFNAIVKEIIPRAKTDKAILKDFNDDLVVGKALGLKADEISKENIAKPLNEFNKKVEYLSKKYDFLEPQAKNSKVKELFVCNISKFREIETKVKCLAEMRECYKRLDIICRKIEKDYSRQR